MTFSSNDYPKLRPLDIRHHSHNGRSYILLRDPLQLSNGSLLIPQPLATALAFCDGATDAAGIAQQFAHHYRVALPVESVNELLHALDDALLLDNPRAQAAVAALLTDYRAAPHRRPLLAGRGYPAGAGALQQMLDRLLQQTDAASKPAADWPERAGLLSPHIDYPRGGHVYAHIWNHAAEAVRAAELVILFGTDHYGDDPFTLTRQHYATPYGVLPTEQPVVDDLAGLLGEQAAFAGELRHRDEHSLELVAVWLHHMRRGEPVAVVPILTGSLRPFDGRDATPDTDPTIEQLLAVLDRAATGRRTVVIASGDLAHVGPAFGGAALTPSARRAVRRSDEQLIEAMQTGSPARFYRQITNVRNANNVCGVAPIYLTMRLLAAQNSPLQGALHGYATCPADDANSSVVTICGMTFLPDRPRASNS